HRPNAKLEIDVIGIAQESGGLKLDRKGAVGRAVSGGELANQGIGLRLSLLDRDTRLQAGKNLKREVGWRSKPVLAGNELLLHGDGGPEIGHLRIEARACEGGRRDADDDECDAIDIHDAADNPWIAVELALPECMAEDRDGMRAGGSVLFCAEDAADCGRNAKTAKIVA